MKSEIFIIGSGGHSRPVLEVLNENYQKINKEIYDLNFKKNRKEKILGVKVVGSYDNFFRTKSKILFWLLGIIKLELKFIKF